MPHLFQHRVVPKCGCYLRTRMTASGYEAPVRARIRALPLFCAKPTGRDIRGRFGGYRGNSALPARRGFFAGPSGHGWIRNRRRSGTLAYPATYGPAGWSPSVEQVGFQSGPQTVSHNQGRIEFDLTVPPRHRP